MSRGHADASFVRTAIVEQATVGGATGAELHRMPYGQQAGSFDHEGTYHQPHKETYVSFHDCNASTHRHPWKDGKRYKVPQGWHARVYLLHHKTFATCRIFGHGLMEDACFHRWKAELYASIRSNHVETLRHIEYALRQKEKPYLVELHAFMDHVIEHRHRKLLKEILKTFPSIPICGHVMEDLVRRNEEDTLRIMLARWVPRDLDISDKI
jgi:hypothetical protein